MLLVLCPGTGDGFRYCTLIIHLRSTKQAPSSVKNFIISLCIVRFKIIVKLRLRLSGTQALRHSDSLRLTQTHSCSLRLTQAHSDSLRLLLSDSDSDQSLG